MTPELTLHEVRIPGFESVTVRVAAPASWVTSILEEPLCFVARMPESEAGPFADNLVVSVETLGEDVPEDFEELQGLIYAQAFEAVPDLHVLDDRALEVGGKGGWFRASLQSAPPGITAVNRQVFTRRGDLLITLSLTTMAFRDGKASELFEQAIETCTITTGEEAV